MDKQMQLFEEGGLNQEGGMIDEVSGNDVPVGSTREEVRDDIPAQLSEGEFVFPADVTRYIGLDKLMQLRQQAKMGLKKMEAMGQMGNSDEATLPDDLPFGMEDLIIIQAEGVDEPQEFNQGGMPVNPNTGVYYTNNTGVTMQPSTQQPPTGGVQPSPQPTMPPPPTQPTGGATGGYQPLFMQGQPPAPTNTNFSTLMEGAELSYKTYINADGETILVPFIGSNALYPIPEGYFEKGSADDPTIEDDEEEDTGEEVEAAAQATSDDNSPAVVEPSAFQKAGGWGMDTSGKDGVSLDMWIKEAQKVTGHGNVVTGLLGLINPLMGAAAWAANKHQKQQIMSMLDEKMAQAKLTPIAGQVAALEKIRDELENGSNAGLLGTVIDKIGEVIGLKPEETKVAKKNTTAAVKETVTTPTKDKDDVEGTEEKIEEPDFIKGLTASSNAPAAIKTITGQSITNVILDSGYNSVEDYAAEVQRRMMQGNETQQDVIKQTVTPTPITRDFTAERLTVDDKQITTPGSPEVRVLEPDFIQGLTTSSNAPAIKNLAAEKAVASNLAAVTLKDKGVTAKNITAADFEKVKDSPEAKAALGIDPNATTYNDVIEQNRNGILTDVEMPEAAVDTTLGETSVIDDLMDTRGLVGGTRLGDKVPFNLLGYGSKESAVDTAVDPLYTFFTSDRSTEIIDRIASGEPVSVAQISQYLETVGGESAPSTTGELLDTGTRIAPKPDATMAERDRFYREKAAREEAERLAREEAARKAAEEAARKKAEEEARVRAAMEKAARERAAAEAAEAARRTAAEQRAARERQDRNEQIVMSQPVAPASSNNDDDDYSPTFSNTQTSSQQAASNVGFGSPTGGWTPAGFDFGQSNSTGGGGGGRAKGGLLEKPKAKTSKKVATKKRGLAARKK